MGKLKKLALSIFAASALCGCHELYDPDHDNNGEYKVWEFVHGYSYLLYYWSSDVPRNVRYQDYPTPRSMMDSWRNPIDRFSDVYNNYTELQKSLNGKYMTDGLELVLQRQKGNVVAGIVQYVYPGSPAWKAGIRRGHVITKVDGIALTADNYSSLLDLPMCLYTCARIVDGGNGSWHIDESLSRNIAVAKCEMDVSPVQMAETFRINGKNIGYMLYNSFAANAKGLGQAIQTMMDSHVTELILDLRMNGGGYARTMDTLASMLVPASVAGCTFINTEYNDYLSQEYRKLEGDDFGQERFLDISPRISNLQHLYVLTSGSTASASEELISGLRPWIDVTTIGGTTYGKFSANLLINNSGTLGTDPDGIPYSEWCIYITTGICRNSQGGMVPSTGIEPDYSINDTYHIPLGSKDEPLLAAAIALASGGAVAKSARAMDNPLPRMGTYGRPAICQGAMIDAGISGKKNGK